MLPSAIWAQAVFVFCDKRDLARLDATCTRFRALQAAWSAVKLNDHRDEGIILRKVQRSAVVRATISGAWMRRACEALLLPRLQRLSVPANALPRVDVAAFALAFPCLQQVHLVVFSVEDLARCQAHLLALPVLQGLGVEIARNQSYRTVNDRAVAVAHLVELLAPRLCGLTLVASCDARPPLDLVTQRALEACTSLEALAIDAVKVFWPGLPTLRKLTCRALGSVRDLPPFPRGLHHLLVRGASAGETELPRPPQDVQVLKWECDAPGDLGLGAMRALRVLVLARGLELHEALAIAALATLRDLTATVPSGDDAPAILDTLLACRQLHSLTVSGRGARLSARVRAAVPVLRLCKWDVPSACLAWLAGARDLQFDWCAFATDTRKVAAYFRFLAARAAGRAPLAAVRFSHCTSDILQEPPFGLSF